MQDQNIDNRFEVVFDNDTEPYLTIRSFDAGALTEIPVTLPKLVPGCTGGSAHCQGREPVQRVRECGKPGPGE